MVADGDAHCPICKSALPTDARAPGRHLVVCPGCSASLEVVVPTQGAPVVRRVATFRRLARFKKLAVFREIYHDLDHVSHYIPARNSGLLAVYLGLIGAAEILTVVISPIVGLILHATVLIALLAHAAAAVNRSVPLARFALAMSIVPIVRVISLTTPLGTFGYLQWFLLIGVVLAASTFVFIRELELVPEGIGIRLPHLRWIGLEAAVILAGIPIGIAEYLLIRPGAVIPGASWIGIIGPAILFIVFTGFLEEVIFRGLLPSVVGPIYGTLGAILIPAAMQSALDLGSLNPLHVLLVGATGILYGLVAHRTKSIAGVGLSHGIANAMLFLVLPRLWG